MAGRIRTIKPEILEDERSGCLSSDAWRLWVSMWLLADDYGRLRGAPEWLKAQVFWAPLHRSIKVQDLLEELSSAGVILRYVVENQRYIEIRTWQKHQKIDHPANPRIPLPSESSRNVSECLARQSECLAPDLDLDLPEGSTQKDQDISPTGRTTFDLAEAYLAYPRKEGKRAGMKKAKEQIKTREDFDRLMVSIGHYKRSSTVLGGFILLFSTFMNGRWEDYVDGPVTGPVEAHGKRTENGERRYSNAQAPMPHTLTTREVKL